MSTKQDYTLTIRQNEISVTQEDMRKKLLEESVKIIDDALSAGLILSEEKEIPYGLKLVFSKNDSIITLNIYYSKKKGVSLVVAASLTNPLRATLEKIIKQVPRAINPPLAEHTWQLWGGTDESGKGDFFGPLVVAGFVADANIKDELVKLGVKDSKNLNDKEISKIARHLHQTYPDRIELLLLKPPKYNELYAQFKAQGKNLNQLLAWMHGRVILNMANKHKFEGIIVDKFAAEHNVINSIKGLDKINIVQKTKAESDIAVAAASIIARFHFVRQIAELSHAYQMDFPKGASAQVKKAALAFKQKYAAEQITNVAKVHFKTWQELI